MTITLIGTGCGHKENMTLQALRAIEEADLVIGAARLQQDLKDLTEGKETVSAYRAEEILQILENRDYKKAVILFSGDISFYSGAGKLSALLDRSDVIKAKEGQILRLPGISSLTAFCAALGFDMSALTLRSAHGRDCDIIGALMEGRRTFFLTGGKETPATICRAISEAGLGDTRVWIGERLSYPDERITACTAGEAAGMSFAPLSVLIADRIPLRRRSLPGIPDAEFIRGKVPMTKQMIRIAVLGLMNPDPEDVCWDIGAGTGSVSIELAMRSRHVYAVEKNKDAADLCRQNRAMFRCWNLSVTEGTAPEALPGLPRPDKVFIGGSSGHIEDILKVLDDKYRELPELLKAGQAQTPPLQEPDQGGGKAPAEHGRRCGVCLTAITLETLEAGRKALDKYGYTCQIRQIQVTDIQETGSYHMMRAENPVFIISGEKNICTDS